MAVFFAKNNYKFVFLVVFSVKKLDVDQKPEKLMSEGHFNQNEASKKLRRAYSSLQTDSEPAISYGGHNSAKLYAFYGGKNKHCAPGLRFLSFFSGKVRSLVK